MIRNGQRRTGEGNDETEDGMHVKWNAHNGDIEINSCLMKTARLAIRILQQHCEAHNISVSTNWTGAWTHQAEMPADVVADARHYIREALSHEPKRITAATAARERVLYVERKQEIADNS